MPEHIIPESLDYEEDDGEKVMMGEVRVDTFWNTAYIAQWDEMTNGLAPGSKFDATVGITKEQAAKLIEHLQKWLAA